MYSYTNKKTSSSYKEVSTRLKYIRNLMRTRAGREKVVREVRDKWL